MVIDGCPYKENQKERAWETGLSTTLSQISTIGINRNITQSDTNVISVTDSVNNNSADLKLDLAIVGTDIILTAENGDSTQQAISKVKIGGASPPIYDTMCECPDSTIGCIIATFGEKISSPSPVEQVVNRGNIKTMNVNNLVYGGDEDHYMHIYMPTNKETITPENIVQANKYYSSQNEPTIYCVNGSAFNGFAKFYNTTAGDVIYDIANSRIKLKEDYYIAGASSLLYIYATINTYMEYYDTEPQW